jgi:hypothetical protein
VRGFETERNTFFVSFQRPRESCDLTDSVSAGRRTLRGNMRWLALLDFKNGPVNSLEMGAAGKKSILLSVSSWRAPTSRKNRTYWRLSMQNVQRA